MTHKIFLTSVIAVSFVASVMAEPTRVDTFPNAQNNEFMQENTVYTNAAIADNMDGAYEHGATVRAVAQYEDILYNIAAGNYLPAGSEETNGVQCTAGNFCTGLTDATYDSESDQGLTSCSTLGDGSYTLSPAGATNGNMCYKTCSASCTNPTAPAHSTNVTYGHETSNGTWNYGSQCNAVAPTCSINFDCVNGYHKRPDITTAQGVALAKQMAQAQGQDITNVPDSYFEEQIEQVFGNWNSFLSSLSAAEQIMVTQAIDSVQGHTHNSDAQTVSIWQPYVDLYGELYSDGVHESKNLNGIIYEKEINGDETCYIITSFNWYFFDGRSEINCSVLEQQNSELAQFRQTAQNGSFFVKLPDKNISYAGVVRCNTNKTDWQNEHKYTMVNGVNVDSDWSGGDMNYTDENCINYAAYDAAFDSSITELMYTGIYKTYGDAGLEQTQAGSSKKDFANSVQVASDTINISDSAPYIDYMCDANTININWLDADDEDITANNAGTAKYDGDIRTPVKAQTIKGKTFKGWRFSAPE